MFREYDYNNKPVVEIVDEMIIDAINAKASDIHFDPTQTDLNVRIRIDGELVNYAKVPESVKKNLCTRIKIVSGMNITETRLPQDGAIKSLGNNASMDLRVSSLPITFGEKIVIRILDYKMSSSGIDNLGLTQGNLNKVKKLVSLPNGIILVSGATGTGKSTTVYSMLQELNKPERNIITVEDPVEMKVDGLNQVQVMSEIGLDFATTLRSILRQDPDTIMIGEIRDDETARIAVRASITGHLVLSTIHTNNALNTIERLLDMNVERYLLGSAISGIIAQRLTKKLCPHCRAARQTSEQEKSLFSMILNTNIDTVYEPVGCQHCINGYKGRVAVFEVLLVDQDIKDMISNGNSKENLRKTIYESDGMSTLLNDALVKVANGLTSVSEVYRIIDVEDDLKDENENLRNIFLGKATNLQESQTITNTTIPETTIQKNNEIKETKETSSFISADQMMPPVLKQEETIDTSNEVEEL